MVDGHCIALFAVVDELSQHHTVSLHRVRKRAQLEGMDTVLPFSLWWMNFRDLEYRTDSSVVGLYCTCRCRTRSMPYGQARSSSAVKVSQIGRGG